jgi:hypothetical protein
MDGLPDARSASAGERTMDMADMRKCIGSAKFGIEAHETPVGDFPAQPSQKDGLGRMCKPHWKQYTAALREAALDRKAADSGAATEVATTESGPGAVASPKAVGGKAAKKPRAAKPEPIRARVPRGRQEAAPEAGSQGDAE